MTFAYCILLYDIWMILEELIWLCLFLAIIDFENDWMNWFFYDIWMIDWMWWMIGKEKKNASVGHYKTAILPRVVVLSAYLKSAAVVTFGTLSIIDWVIAPSILSVVLTEVPHTFPFKKISLHNFNKNNHLFHQAFQTNYETTKTIE